MEISLLTTYFPSVALIFIFLLESTSLETFKVFSSIDTPLTGSSKDQLTLVSFLSPPVS